MKHAVLFQMPQGDYVIADQNEKNFKLGAVPDNLERLLVGMEKTDIQCLWVMPGSDFSRTITTDKFNTIDSDRWRVFPPVSTMKRKQPDFMSMTRRLEKYTADRYIAFPEHGEWSSRKQWDIPSAYTLLTTIGYVEQEYKQDAIWSPGNIGMRVLKQTHKKRGWVIENLQKYEELRPVLNLCMVRPVWRRELTACEQAMHFLHGYDKNGQYLGASQSVTLGGNVPFLHVDGSAYDAKSIGFWKYRIKDIRNTVFNGMTSPYKNLSYPNLYCPLDTSRAWASTDLIQAALSVGVDIDILQGVVWSEGERYLAAWSKDMWTHRAAFTDVERFPEETARLNALGTSKIAANSLMGRLAKEGINEYHRPDWNLLVVHRAIANQVYSFSKVQREHGIYPVLVSTDAFYIVSDDPNPYTAIPGILDHQAEQRGYKHIGTIELTSDLAEQFRTARADDLSVTIKNLMEDAA